MPKPNKTCNRWCWVIILAMVLFLSAVTCLYFGLTCDTAAKRNSKQNLSTCKNIHNDDSAKVLQAFGWLFNLPFLVACVWAYKGNTKVEPTDSSASSVKFQVV